LLLNPVQPAFFIILSLSDLGFQSWRLLSGSRRIPGRSKTLPSLSPYPRVCDKISFAFLCRGAFYPDACEYLNTFYVETRYPVHWPTNFSYVETEKALKGSDQIRSVIKEKIDLPE
jgi:hypothetical protein